MPEEDGFDGGVVTEGKQGCCWVSEIVRSRKKASP